jgi:hypothetical protein
MSVNFVILILFKYFTSKKYNYFFKLNPIRFCYILVCFCNNEVFECNFNQNFSLLDQCNGIEINPINYTNNFELVDKNEFNFISKREFFHNY